MQLCTSISKLFSSCGFFPSLSSTSDPPPPPSYAPPSNATSKLCPSLIWQPSQFWRHLSDLIAIIIIRRPQSVERYINWEVPLGTCFCQLFSVKVIFQFNRWWLRMRKGKVMPTRLWFQVLSCRCWIYEYIWSIWAYMLWYLEERWRVVRMRLRIHIRFGFYSNSGRGRYSQEGIHSYTR